MAVLAQALLNEAQSLLGDSFVRWSEAQMLQFLSDGEAEVSVLKPSAHTISTAHSLVAGTRQSLPALATLLVKVSEALSATNTVYPAPKIIPTERLNDILPGWRSAAASDVVQLVTYDPANPLQFEVYPPQPDADSGTVHLTCFSTPPRFALPVAPATTTTEAIHINDHYGPALVDYLLYRCYQVDTATGSAELAQRYLSDFSAKVQAALPRAGGQNPAQGRPQ